LRRVEAARLALCFRPLAELAKGEYVTDTADLSCFQRALDHLRRDFFLDFAFDFFAGFAFEVGFFLDVVLLVLFGSHLALFARGLRRSCAWLSGRRRRARAMAS
jgi:hypothetical protein